jgi:hypothetical protein
VQPLSPDQFLFNHAINSGESSPSKETRSTDFSEEKESNKKQSVSSWELEQLS